MLVAVLVVGWALCVATLRTPLAYAQRAHYRPMCPVSRRYVVGQCLLVGCALAAALVAYFWVPSVYYPIVPAAFLLPQVGLVVLFRRPHLRFTARAFRLWLAAGLLAILPFALASAYPVFVPFVVLVAAMPYGVVQLAACPLYPLEQWRNAHFVRRMAARLAHSDLVVIGVTGSAGKTSVKQMLRCILGDSCYVTPGNYNTPMGLALAVRAMPKAGLRYFVAEMGAARVGDIDDLLSFVRPHIGVLTCVLPQHTARFGTVQTIRREKAKVLAAADWSVCGENMAGEDAAGTIQCDCMVGRDVWAENTVLHRQGTTFDLVTPTARLPLVLPLCGRQCVANALVAWAVAHHLGVADCVIAARLACVPRDPHRLCPTCNAAGVTIVDDSYNCNIRGAQYALEYISLYRGRKIVATSGIDESDPALGLNAKLAAMLDAACDIVVLVGDRYSAQMLPHITHAKVYTMPTTASCVPLYASLLHAGDVLLVMADYPM